jgi:DNA-binding PadR family transcriptional regulator
MNISLLIQAVVRQTTILVAQLATSGGVRAPLAHVANQVFLDLTTELEAQGVSRKVGADMFGMALRAYQKKIQRLNESSSERGRSLWEAVLAYLEQHEFRTRHELLTRFARDDEAQLRGVLHDLVENGLVSASGSGAGTVYRCTTSDERRAAQNAAPGLEELLWVLLYREGRRSPEQLAQACGRREEELTGALQRLVEQGRIERVTNETAIGEAVNSEERAGEQYLARSFAVPLGSATGWEAAVFDHYHALVKTLCVRLQQPTQAAELAAINGGSTFTFKVWDGHPHKHEVLGTLAILRRQLGELRRKVEDWNEREPGPSESLAITVYAGQCAIEQGTNSDFASEGTKP